MRLRTICLAIPVAYLVGVSGWRFLESLEFDLPPIWWTPRLEL